MLDRISRLLRATIPVVLVGATVLVGVQSAPAGAVTVTPVGPPGGCPWTSASFDASYTPSQLAEMVVSKMTVNDELDLVDLARWHGYENRTTPVPALCIPALTLQDGPNGIANHDRGVTQLPASIGLAASFDTTLAREYGTVLGKEARGQGVDVVQGPNLNIARVPEAGRIFEGYGEDPFLVSAMGDADIEGIQSEGVMADAKHFGAYTQETDRISLNQDVDERALEEIYLPPFKAAVTQADVASVMCSYGSIDETPTCADRTLYRTLYGAWDFQGFVRSDLRAVRDPVAAFAAGMDQIKPAARSSLAEAVADGTLSSERLAHAAERVLTEMFAYHLVEEPLGGRIDRDVTDRADKEVALSVAEASAVLLRDDGVLPLSQLRTSSIAVIGNDAASVPDSAGRGSAAVIAPSMATPLASIRQSFPDAVVTATGGGTQLGPLTPIAGRITDERLGDGLSASHLIVHPSQAEIGTGDVRDAEGMRVLRATLLAPSSGTYDLSVSDNGNAWFYVNGHLRLAERGLEQHQTVDLSQTFSRGEVVHLELAYFQDGTTGPPSLGWTDETEQIERAVSLAKRASTAIVFVADPEGEGADRPNLSLPGDENALVEAVAKANRRTVVVINSGGAVVMPWLSRVAAVIEAWYPGEVDGTAIAAVLDGAVDPSGRLPLTFPASSSQGPTASTSEWPGVDGTVHFDEGLEVGYRWFDANRVRPLFPFGFGLDYTKFRLSNLEVDHGADGYSATVTVTNTGTRNGTEVVQAYLGFPENSGEPPDGLVGFARIGLAPGASGEVTVDVPASSFEAYLGSSWQEVPGTYDLRVGTSSADLPLSAELAPPSALISPSGPTTPTPSPSPVSESPVGESPTGPTGASS